MVPSTGAVRPVEEVAAEMVRPGRAQRRADNRTAIAMQERERKEAEERLAERLRAMPLGSMLPTGEVLVSGEVAHVLRAGKTALKKASRKAERRAKNRRAAAARSRSRNR